jgi:mRNA-degrading endonuclease RelE of RelBE toxin-antitoxin system
LYRIHFAQSAEDQFAGLTARHRAILRDAVREQLQYEPFQETRRRKRLRPNPLAPWELRIGNLRVFYEPDAADPGRVNLLAIGVKKGNRLFIAGEEMSL